MSGSLHGAMVTLLLLCGLGLQSCAGPPSDPMRRAVEEKNEKRERREASDPKAAQESQRVHDTFFPPPIKPTDPSSHSYKSSAVGKMDLTRPPTSNPPINPEILQPIRPTTAGSGTRLSVGVSAAQLGSTKANDKGGSDNRRARESHSAGSADIELPEEHELHVDRGCEELLSQIAKERCRERKKKEHQENESPQ